jgi:hypothetical protein
MLSNLGGRILVTGHYGSGKTNFATNIAIRLRAMGKPVALVDLDIVNPYFRAADFSELMEKHDIQLLAPAFANSNLDVPALSAGVDGLLADKTKTVILDVGGDDAGATALGRYAARIAAGGYDMLYVVNCFRLLTHSPAEALQLLRQIEKVSRLRGTRIVNNANLSTQTTAEEWMQSIPYTEEISAQSGLPVLCHCAHRELAQKLTGMEKLFPVDIYVKPPWLR